MHTFECPDCHETIEVFSPDVQVAHRCPSKHRKFQSFTLVKSRQEEFA